MLDRDSVDWLDDRPDDWPDPFIHIGVAEHRRSGDRDHPVLLSYVDTVIAGFLNRFGENGPQHFVDTTLDWHVPVLNDRRDPRYSRAVRPTCDERARVDALMASLGVTMIDD